MGKLYFITGDYIKNSKGMDAIVDAQNKYMGVGGNICGLILRAAGKKELLDYCKEHYEENMYPSEVRITPGFNLPMKIIHVLAPIYRDEKEPLKIMEQTYINLINSIKENKFKRVLVCSLGTGSHGYDPNEIAPCVVKILSDFCDENDVEIYFNNMYPLQKDVYLEEYVRYKNINISVLDTNDIDKIDVFIRKNNLIDINIEELFNDFIQNDNLNDMSLSEKLIYFQYMKTKKGNK